MILTGDALTMLRTLDEGSVQCCITSPPYWGLRDYGADGQIGLEETVEEYVANIVSVFREVRRVLRSDGTLWLNLGDCYASTGGSGWQGKHGARANRSHTQRRLKGRVNLLSGGLKPKDLVGIPWMVAFALRAEGWYLRRDIIWHKPNPMPESVRDRPATAHEYIFLMSKSESYFYDCDAIREPHAAKTLTHRGGGRCGKAGQQDASGKVASGNWAGTPRIIDPRGRTKRSVWTVATHAFKGAHFATFPKKLITPCVLAGSRIGDTVLDPFSGAGTTGMVAMSHRRKYIGIEINPEYVAMTRERLAEVQLEMFA